MRICVQLMKEGGYMRVGHREWECGRSRESKVENCGQQERQNEYVRVVAPTNCKPLANAGLIICPPSIDPSALPKLNSVSNANPNVSSSSSDESGGKGTHELRR